MNVIAKIHEGIEKEGLWTTQLVLKRNEYLKVAGTTDSNLYYVISGSLKIFMINDFEEHIVRFGYKKNFIAALDSFITEKPSDFYIQAIKKTKLNVVSKANFIKFKEKDPINKLLWDQVLEQVVVQQLERERDILTTSPKERYERVLKRSPKLFQEIPSKYIASYLRMSPETFSRLKKS